MQVADLLTIHKSLRADVIGRDEEVSSPADHLQPIGDQVVRAYASVVERYHPGTGLRGFIRHQIGYEDRPVGHDLADRHEVSIELIRLHLVEGRAGARETARLVRRVFDSVVIPQLNYPLLFRPASHRQDPLCINWAVPDAIRASLMVCASDSSNRSVTTDQS